MTRPRAKAIVLHHQQRLLVHGQRSASHNRPRGAAVLRPEERAKLWASLEERRGEDSRTAGVRLPHYPLHPPCANAAMVSPVDMRPLVGGAQCCSPWDLRCASSLFSFVIQVFLVRGQNCICWSFSWLIGNANGGGGFPGSLPFETPPIPPTRL